MPASMGFREDYEAVKKAHPGNIVLYQLGDFYEMFGPDARVASFELELMLTQRNFPDTGRVAMCGIPGHKLDEYVQKLRDRHDVTVSSIGPDGERRTVSYLSVEHEARNAREAEAQEETTPVHVPGASPPIPA
ncbi:MAG: hypothetical protein K2O93_03275, partial [Oscillospiraceae bacterium]|nr:hypothetical protein [Oscillospiraceae bacterium]